MQPKQNRGQNFLNYGTRLASMFVVILRYTKFNASLKRNRPPACMASKYLESVDNHCRFCRWVARPQSARKVSLTYLRRQLIDFLNTSHCFLTIFLCEPRNGRQHRKFCKIFMYDCTTAVSCRRLWGCLAKLILNSEGFSRWSNISKVMLLETLEITWTFSMPCAARVGTPNVCSNVSTV